LLSVGSPEPKNEALATHNISKRSYLKLPVGSSWSPTPPPPPSHGPPGSSTLQQLGRLNPPHLPAVLYLPQPNNTTRRSASQEFFIGGPRESVAGFRKPTIGRASCTSGLEGWIRELSASPSIRVVGPRRLYVGLGRPKCVAAYPDRISVFEIERLPGQSALVNAVALHQKMRPQRLLSHAREFRPFPDCQIRLLGVPRLAPVGIRRTRSPEPVKFPPWLYCSP
jgi:hypothetical protein